MTIQERFGARVRELRSKHGWSQEQLSEHADIGVRHIRDIELGTKEVCLLAIEKLADAFGISIPTLMTLDKQKKPPTS